LQFLTASQLTLEAGLVQSYLTGLFLAIIVLSAHAAPHSHPSRFNPAAVFLGTWQVSEHHEAGPWGPGYDRQGTMTESLGPGAHSHLIQFTVAEQNLPAGFEVLTWDPAIATFTGYAFNDKGPGSLVTTGRFDENGLTFTGDITVGSNKIHLVKVLKDITPNSYTITISASIDGGPLLLSNTSKLRRLR
jgi:hypothetical protein